MGLVTHSTRDIAVVEVRQLSIVMLFKPLILVLGRVSGVVNNVPGFCNASELIAMVFCTECSKGRGHDHGV